MNEQHMLNCQMRQWEAKGRWVDAGVWVRGNWRQEEYWPSAEEIAAKCALFRSIRAWHGANKRAPRGGEFAVATTAGI
jgi:hypothetical protein